MAAEDKPLEDRRFGAGRTLGGLVRRDLEHSVNLVPEVPRYQRLLASLDDFPVAVRIADVADVAEAVVDRLDRPRPSGETLDSLRLELRRHLLRRSVLQEELEDAWDVLRRVGIWHEVLVLDLVAVWRDSPDEVALVERRSEVPLDALLDRLAFPLPEGDDEVHDELAHRRRGVDKRFRNRGEPDSELLHLLVELAEVLCASGHAVDAEHDDLVDQPLFALADQPTVGGAVEIAAAVAVVIEPLRQGDPSFGSLGGDEALAHLALGVD